MWAPSCLKRFATDKFSMSADERTLEAQRWLRYSIDDLVTAELVLGNSKAAPRQACLLAQQAAEKALKAVLIFESVEFPKTHDLDALRNLVPDA